MYTVAWGCLTDRKWKMSRKRKKRAADIHKSYPKALQSEKPSSHWLVFLGLASIIIITLLVYTPAIRGDFIWDDDQYVSENPLLKSASGLGKIWSLRLITAPDNRSYLISNTPQYYPLVFSTFWLESHLWDQSNPTGFHVVNVLLHIANALLVWLICHRLGFRWAYLAALIFALHPVEVESVAWIAERKNVLSGLFYLLTLLSFLRFDKTRRKVFYFTALGCFVLALLSKTVTCTLPVILLLILWLRHRRLSWSDLPRLIPFFVVGAVFGLFTAYLERYKVGAVGPEWEIAFWQRWVIAGRAVFFYASKLLWPVNLTFIYPRWNPDGFSLLGLLWPAAAIALTLVLWSRRKSIGRAPLVAWAGFVITLFPALGFFNVYPFRFSFVADHFQYLASIFCITLFVGLGHGLYKRIYPQGFKFLVFPSVRILLISTVLLLLGYLTYAQALMYQDVESLWKTTIRRNPGAWMAWNNLGVLHTKQGNYVRAIQYLTKSLESRSRYPEAYNNRGSAYYKKGDYDRAIRDFDQAIKLRHRYSSAYSNRGAAYSARGDFELAIRDLDQAIEFNPSYARGYYNRGNAYFGKGKYDRAIGDFSETIRLNPSFVEAYNNRGAAYSARGDYELAIRDLDQAIALKPMLAEAYSNRGVAYSAKGDYDQAIRDFDKVIELEPGQVNEYNNRGLAYRRKGDYDQAIRDFEQVIELNPENALAHKNIGQTLIRQGKPKEAVSHYRRALELRADWLEVLNNLAWILATCEDAEIRDGAQAVRLAERACDLTDYEFPAMLDTLGAAYAETGQFDQAVQTAQNAFQLALASKNAVRAKNIQNRLELYKANRPYRESFSLEAPTRR